jgi:hypothetical protein
MMWVKNFVPRASVVAFNVAQSKCMGSPRSETKG